MTSRPARARVPRASCLACLALLGLGVSSTAAEPLIRHLDPQAQIALWVERAAIDAVTRGKPGSLWRDPQAAATVAHVTAQLRLLNASEPSAPPVIPVLEHGQRLLFQGWAVPTGAGIGRWREPEYALLLDAGEAAAAMRAYLAVHAPKDSALPARPDAPRVLPATALMDESDGRFTVAVDRQRHPLLLARARENAIAPPAPTPFWVSADTGPLIAAAVLTLERHPEVVANIDAIIPGWRTCATRLVLTAVVEPDGWRNRVIGPGMKGLPLKPVGKDLLALAGRDRQVVIAAGIRPETLAMLLSVMDLEPKQRLAVKVAGVPPSEQDQLAQLNNALRDKLGVDSAGLGRLLSGEILIQAGWTVGPIPQASAVLAVSDRAGVEALIGKLATAQGWSTGDVPGARAWSVPLPIGFLTIAVTDGRLVLGNDADEVAALIAGTPGGGSLVEGRVLQARIDLPAIARQWLPVGYAALAGLKRTLGNDPLRSLGYSTWQIGTAWAGDQPPASVSAAMLAGHHPDRRAWLPLFPGPDVAGSLDASVSIYRQDAQPDAKKKQQRQRDTRLVVRLDSGWLVLGSGRNRAGEPMPLAPADLAADLQGFTKVLGRDPEDLAVITPPQRAVFDKRWLPPLPVVLRHIPPLRIDAIHAADGTLVVEEHGVPLVGLLATAGAFAMWVTTDQLDQQRGRRRQQEQQERMQKRFPAAFVSLDKAGRALRALTQNDRAKIPAKASDLVIKGTLRLADCSGINGGAIPASAEVLDQLGRWTADPGDDFSAPVWAFHLEDDLSVAVTTWGQVIVVVGLVGVPSVPAAGSGGTNMF